MKQLRPTTILQILISAALLAVVFRNVPLREASQAIMRLRPSTLAAALTMSMVAYWGRALRWRMLLQRAGVSLPPWRAYWITLVGIFYGLLTPGRVGEFARVLHLDVPRSRTVPSVIWDRVADVLLLEALALPAFLVIDSWRGPLLWVYLAVVALSLAGVFVLTHQGSLEQLRRLAPWAARPLAEWERGSAGMLLSQAFRSGIAGGLFFYALSFGAAYLLVRDLAPEAPPQLVLSFPVIPLLGNLPIAFGGLGLREQVSATVFGQLGAGSAIGPVFSLVWFAVMTLIPGLVGLLASATPLARFAAVSKDAHQVT